MRIFSILYFVILFAILGSYLIYAAPDDHLRLRVASADTLAPEQTNMLAIWVRDLKTGSIFESGHTLEARWITSDLQPANHEYTTVPLPQNGETAMPMPKIPQTAVAGIEVLLKDKNQQILKNVVVPAHVFEQAPHIQYLETQENSDNTTSYYAAFAPAAFMFDAPNEVFITAFENGEPMRGDIQIEQIYGLQKADIPSTLKASKTGITRTHFTLHSPADFKFTLAEKEFYATFIPGNKPLHAAIHQPILTPTDKPQIKVNPVASMPTLYIDYFEGNAWIDRQIIPPHEVNGTKLDPNYVFSASGPRLLYARVAASALPTPDTAQTFPLIVSSKPMTQTEQAAFALQMMQADAAVHPEIDFIQAWFTQNTPSQSQARAIRDYTLSQIATHHAPDIALRVKSEEIEAKAFSREKQTQKIISNIILIIWFGLGILVYIAAALKITRERKKLWQEITETGSVPEGMQFQTISPVQIFLIIFLAIGFCIALIWVMQII